MIENIFIYALKVSVYRADFLVQGTFIATLPQNTLGAVFAAALSGTCMLIFNSFIFSLFKIVGVEPNAIHIAGLTFPRPNSMDLQVL